MKTKLIKTAFFTLLLQSAMVHASEANCDKSHQWWMNLGVGVGSASDFGTGPAAQLSFNGMLTDKLFVTLARTATGGTGTYEPMVSELGLLLGYKRKQPNWYWSAAAGVSYWKLNKHYDYYTTNYWSSTWESGWRTENQGVGLPIEGQLFWTPFKHFGVGVIAHGTVSDEPYATAMLAIQIS